MNQKDKDLKLEAEIKLSESKIMERARLKRLSEEEAELAKKKESARKEAEDNYPEFSLSEVDTMLDVLDSDKERIANDEEPHSKEALRLLLKGIRKGDVNKYKEILKLKTKNK